MLARHEVPATISLQRVESKYTYDAPANTNTMVYDGLGNRVKKLNPTSGNTVLVYDVFGDLAAEYAGGAGSGCSPCYLFQDPIGSTRLIVNQNQAVVRRYDTMPFGEEIWRGTGWANGRGSAEYSMNSAVKLRYGGGV